MRSLLVLIVVLALPAQALAAPASVRLIACATALEQAQRSATFEGVMRAARGSLRMQMRFTLQARMGRGTAWMRVAGSKLDTWVASDAGRTAYVYDKRVDHLLAPADYRVRVRFRWLDGDGRMVARALRVSRVCHQPDLRPDLRLGAVTAEPGATAGSYRYLVTVRNTGRSAAAPFAVSLAPAGGAAVVEQADALAPGERTTLVFDAPACEPGSLLQVVLDADEQVDEAAEGDDAAAVPCPARG
jgi:hypothetical protein